MEYISCNTANVKVKYIIPAEITNEILVKAILNETIIEAIEAKNDFGI